MRKLRIVGVVAAIVILASVVQAAPEKPSMDKGVRQGELRIKMKDGSIVSCPLKHTDVKATISGFIARVKVRQRFYNPLNEKIEAVYVFPLPHGAAVDDMTMIIGDRRIVGIIKRRAAARAIYERALRHGRTAALLEQERPNIFTQSVGNIKPKQEVVIEISYVDVLKYDMGVYDFHFPMVVGPRFIPGGPTSKTPLVPPELQGKVGKARAPEGNKDPKGTGWSPDTSRVPDASRITPPVLKPGFRNGHDISLAVELDAGVPIQNLQVKQHKASVKREGKAKASIKMDPADSIPNKDFVLRYAVVGKKPELAVLAHAERGAGYFMLMVQPKEDERLKKTPPREIFFLVDVSGSMRGRPMAQVRQAMKKFLANSKQGDTFQLVTFAGSARELFDKPQLIDDASLTKAVNAIDRMRGGGGTRMLQGIVKCLKAPADPKRVRIVIMLTDGYIGNEKEIIGEVGRRCGDRIRFWTIGVGTSVNRYLIDGVAKQGQGMSKVLGLDEDPGKLVQEVMFRIHRAQLAKIKIDWGGLDVFEMYPAKVPELWAGRPVILFARYRRGGKATIKVNGVVEGEPASFPVEVELPEAEDEHDVLAKVWARKKIEYLMGQNMIEASAAVVEEVTEIALDYRLMSQYTSFVAVDRSEAETAEARPPRRMLVPVPLPEGVSFAGVFGGPGGEMPADEMMMDAGGTVMTMNAFGSVREWGKGRIRAAAPSAPLSGAMVYRALPALVLPGPMPEGKLGDLKKAQTGAMYYSAIMKDGGRRWSRGGGDNFADRELQEGYARRDGGIGAAAQFAAQAFAAGAPKRAAEAKKALAAGKGLAKKGDTVAALAQFQFAYLLDAAAMMYRKSDGKTAREALGEIAKLTEKTKALDKKLDLVIRNKVLKDALRAVLRASGVKCDFVPGSTRDAKKLLGRDELRVTYLDLRGATVRQAFDWILNPMRLSWTVKGGRLVLGSARQMGGPWVYDVSLLALPDAKEFKGKKRQDRQKYAKQSTDQFLAAVKTVAPSAVWYAPGQVLVFGEKKTHDAVAALLDELAEPGAKPADSKEVTDLQKVTSARYAARKEAHAKYLAALARARVVRKMAEHSWALYAAALKGEVSLEHLSELQAAWADPRCKELLDKASFTAIRSTWLIGASAKMLPKNAELQALAKTSLTASYEPIRKTLIALPKKSDAASFVKALYGEMAADLPGLYKVDAETRKAIAKGRGELTTVKPGKDPLAGLRLIARVLLEPIKDVDGAAKAVQKLAAEQRLRGDDMVVLGALAARRLGGDTWDKFRANQSDILGKQRLSGQVIVLVNRLAAAPETVIAKK